MRNHRSSLLIAAFLSLAFNTSAATLYVDLNCTNPTPPYTNWATAATNIQDAVDTASAGDSILVTNGVYQTGGRKSGTANNLTNRVAVTKPVTLRSVNGPAVTMIKGYQAPFTTNGPSAVRCVYLTNGAALSGFTLTNGATANVMNQVPSGEESGGGVWCESVDAVVSNCVLVGNAALSAGGAAGGTLIDCTLAGNRAGSGGGAGSASLSNCLLRANSARNAGGASAACLLVNCVLIGNSAGTYGGGAAISTLFNCAVVGNSAVRGGGTWLGSLSNCTLTGNSVNPGGDPASSGGGAYSSTLNNCLIYYNNAKDTQGANFSGGSLNFCCTTPLPPGGTGNFDAEPELADPVHLSASSPCRGAGSPLYAIGVDIDGESWGDPPAAGCDEYVAEPITGPLAAGILADYTNVATGYGVNLAAQIEGHAAACAWSFGDGTVVSNRPFLAHSWSVAGDYSVVLIAYNDGNPGGVSATVTVHVVEHPIHYVAFLSPSPTPPYDSWAKAARNIQDAVDAAFAGGTVLVSNGVYTTGGRTVYGATTNRVAISKPLTVQSVNGPQVTRIEGSRISGGAAVRCVYLTDGAALIGFTLTKGTTDYGGDSIRDDSGGGVWCTSTNAVLSNCVLSSNHASDYGGGSYLGTLNQCELSANLAVAGGGAFSGTLNRCLLVNNRGGGACSNTLNNCGIIGNSSYYGGGALYAVLNNCTLTGNSANYAGGGAYASLLNNCIVYYNTAPTDPNYSGRSDFGGSLNHCCTTPDAGGVGNITNEPLFVNLAGGNFRLQPNSPCINAGNNSYVTNATDFDGSPRISGGTVDIGAYEFQSPSSVLSFAWLQQYGLPTDGTADYIDTDNDLLNNWQEWQALTDPTNALSVLKLLSLASTTNPPGMTITWQSSSGVIYYVQRSSDLKALPQFLTIQSNIIGQAGTTSYTDTNAVGLGPYFYRVGAGTPPVPTVRCVDVNCTNPVPPYIDWSTAATNIQDAVDVANTNDLVLVNNGVYATGGRTMQGSLTNRLVVDKTLTVRSVNGPQVTVIQGYQVPGTTNGPSAVRCVWLTGTATLAGFTLTKGATFGISGSGDDIYGGGVFAVPSITYAIVSNCVLTGNSAGIGGGACWPSLLSCTLTRNSASVEGGGAVGSKLNNCTVSGNSSPLGGGTYSCSLANCIVTSNSASKGGGVHLCSLVDCLLFGNSATMDGGAAYGAVGAQALINCTIVSNSAGTLCAGALAVTLKNCIVYHNYAGGTQKNYYSSVLTNCCTTPLPPTGAGNITNEPLLVNLAGGDCHLLSTSPCIDAGNNAYVSGSTDLDGRPRIAGGTVDMGAYESQTHFVDPSSTNPTPPYWDWSTAATGIQDAVDVAGAGDQILVTNGVYQTGGRVVYGALTNRVAVTKAVTVQSVNGPEVTVIKGYQMPGTTNGDSAIRCVYLTNNAVLSGFTLTNGATRAAGDYILERSGGGLWCESTNGAASNCVITANSASDQGGGAYHATLSNCALSANSATEGGGAYGGVLSRCAVAGNVAKLEGGGATLASVYYCTIISNNAGRVGGGALHGFLDNCLVVSNRAAFGGGVNNAVGVNCTIVGNTAEYDGGGSYSGTFITSTLSNCVVYNNTAQVDANFHGGSLSHCCTTPDPGGNGNITNEPMFVSLATGDFHLQSYSPCINAGNNIYVTNSADIDGNPRISGGTVDIGAYEFQNPNSVLSYAWLQQFGLPIDGTADYIDTDNDQLNNFQEWRAGTNPTNALSLLKMLTLSNDVAGTTVTWQSVGGVGYSVERSDLTGGAGFSAIQSNLTGQAGTTSFTDTNAPSAPRLYYRVGVQ